MSVSVGQVVYNHGEFPCSGVGIVWKSKELDEAVGGPVAAALFDESGKNSIREMVAGIPETEFERKALDDMLNDPQEVEDWRVGEVIAETYLTHHRSCEFPWPSDRDKKSIGSSLPGADLAGFGTDSKGDCFAFGEVKTSSDGIKRLSHAHLLRERNFRSLAGSGAERRSRKCIAPLRLGKMTESYVVSLAELKRYIEHVLRIA